MRSERDIDRRGSDSILVLDDEPAIADLVVDALSAEGIDARAFYDAPSALEALVGSAFGLAIVDIMMPGMDGFEFLRQLRRFSEMPVIFLSAKDQETDIVVGFELGAEDYITKPFKPRELVARVKARLRKARRPFGATEGSGSGASNGADVQDSADDGILRSRGIELIPALHRAALYDVPLALTPKEFSVLRLLLERKGQPVSSKELYTTVWEEPAISTSANTVMVHIRRLRNKLAEIDSSEQFITTVWGVGYMIESAWNEND